MQLSKRSTRFGLLVTAASFFGAAAFAAAPPAGTRIGNQAAASYTNAAGDRVDVTSNKVETIVQQVAGVDLEADVSETASAGGKVFLPHTITNTGNGDDSYTLTALDNDTGVATAPASTFDFTSIKIFPDANLDGVADSTTPITVTPELAAGEVFGIVIEAVVPTSAGSDDLEEIIVTATSTETGTVTDTNTDTVTVSEGPVTELQKSMVVTDSDSNGTDPGDIVTITITYDSTGLTNAANLTVTDQLDQYLEYNLGSATWSDSTGALTDAVDAPDPFEATNGSGHKVNYSYDGTDTVTFVVDSVPSGRTGSITFTATIAADAPAGVIDNIATQTVEDPGNPGTPITMPPSNKPSITVVNQNLVTIADRQSVSYQADPDGANLTGALDSTADGDGSDDDIVTEVNDVAQGASIPFDFVVTNHSNSPQTFDIQFANVDFPSGTTFTLEDEFGSPIAGPIGNVAPGAATKVVLVANLPANVGPVAAGATNYTATVTATPSAGGDPNSATAEFTGAITAAAVDLTNAPVDGDGGDGDNPTDGGNPWHNETTDPGAPATFSMEVENQGPTADNYDISITGLPAGYTAVAQLPDGTPITNTGDIPAGDVASIQIVVTPPPGTPPTTTPIPFDVTLTSPVTNQSDSITNSISVNEVLDLVLEQDQLRQAAPGGVIDIPHTLRNDGNIAVTEGALAPAGDLTTFSGALFYDANNNGVADAGDSIIDNIDDIPGGIPAGGEVPLVLRVQVPSSATSGTTETETINVATSLNGGAATDSVSTNNAVTDTITIISGDLTLNKLQAVDPNCDGNPGGFVTSIVNANPGECIAYRITAENTGTANATLVEITDSTPTWTTYTGCGGSCDAAVTGGTAPAITPLAEGAAGQLKATYGTLIPGGTAVLNFTVQIAN